MVSGGDERATERLIPSNSRRPLLRGVWQVYLSSFGGICNQNGVRAQTQVGKKVRTAKFLGEQEPVGCETKIDLSSLGRQLFWYMDRVTMNWQIRALVVLQLLRHVLV